MGWNAGSKLVRRVQRQARDHRARRATGNVEPRGDEEEEAEGGRATHSMARMGLLYSYILGGWAGSAVGMGERQRWC